MILNKEWKAVNIYLKIIVKLIKENVMEGLPIFIGQWPSAHLSNYSKHVLKIIDIGRNNTSRYSSFSAAVHNWFRCLLTSITISRLSFFMTHNHKTLSTLLCKSFISSFFLRQKLTLKRGFEFKHFFSFRKTQISITQKRWWSSHASIWWYFYIGKNWSVLFHMLISVLLQYLWRCWYPYPD